MQMKPKNQFPKDVRKNYKDARKNSKDATNFLKMQALKISIKNDDLHTLENSMHL